MIQVEDVTKRYGSVIALQELSLTVPVGTVFGVLGPNGAGKTTLLRLVVGVVLPDRGAVRITGCQRHQVGYLPERPHFPGRFRVAEYLKAMGQLGGLVGTSLSRGVSRSLAQTGLEQVADRRINTCSKGMLQRLAVAQALLSDPPLLLLDEPFSGLDPAAQVVMRQVAWDLSRTGKTIVVSTHRLSDVNQMCSHIAILARGRLARAGPLSEVLVPRSRTVIRVNRVPDLVAWQLGQLHPALVVDQQLGEVGLPAEALPVKAAVLRLLLDARIDVLHVEQQRATLEEVYLETVQS